MKNRENFLLAGIRQIARNFVALLFCVIIFVSFLTDIDSVIWQALIGLISFLLFTTVVYCSLNQCGIDDRNFNASLRRPDSFLRGGLIALVSALPFLGFNLWFALSYVPPDPSNLKLAFNLVNSPVFFVTVFSGLESPAAVWTLSCLLPVWIVIAGTAGYILGLKGIQITKKLFYKSKKDTEPPKNDYQF